MKGLILKDIYQTMKYLRAFLVIIVIFLVASVFIGASNSFYLYYPMLLTSMTPLSLMVYDDQNKWTSWADTLPYTRAQVVSAKYVLTLILVAGMLVLSTIAMLLNADFRAAGILRYLLPLTAMGLLCPSLSFPFMFKLGAEKGRLFYFIILGVFCALAVFIFSFYTSSAGNVFSNISLLLNLTPVFGLLLFLLSWRLSIYLYKKRDL